MVAVAPGKQAQATGRAQWGSDVVIEMIQAYGIKYAPIMLGSSCRGLLDSMVNFGENKAPEVIETLHEEAAVSIAIGYAGAAHKPLVAFVHDTVGTLHIPMAMHGAYTGNIPLIVIGGAGPFSKTQRRPQIDWQHLGMIQGNLVRDYVKWDDQPHDAASFPESFMRAYRLAMTEPKGPVYLAVDVAWQEARLDQPINLPDISYFMPPTPIQGDPTALRRTAELLARAAKPLILAGHVGRNPEAVTALAALAEAGNIPVMDVGGNGSFPNTHRLDASGSGLIRQADIILVLDVGPEIWRLLHRADRWTRGDTESVLQPGCQTINMSLNDLIQHSISQEYGELFPFDMSVTADTIVAIPEIARLVKEEMAKGSNQAGVMSQRASWVEETKATVRKRWDQEYAEQAGTTPISHARLAQEVWNVIKDEKNFFLRGDPGGWARRLWKLDRPGIKVGGSGGLGTGPAAAVGAALAAKERSPDGFCVAFGGDGDFLFMPTALWTAAHHKLPLLYFILDNGGYMGESGHAGFMAEQRDRSLERAHVAVHITNPSVDMAAMVRPLGVHAEGPIVNPDDLAPAIQRAFKAMKDNSQPAVIHVRTEHGHLGNL